MQDTSGWATYYASKGVHRESAPLHNLNMQVRVCAQHGMCTC